MFDVRFSVDLARSEAVFLFAVLVISEARVSSIVLFLSLLFWVFLETP